MCVTSCATLLILLARCACAHINSDRADRTGKFDNDSSIRLDEIKVLRFSTREPDERSLYLQSPGGHGHGGVDQVAHGHLHHHWMQQYQQIVTSCKTEEVISSHLISYFCQIDLFLISC